MANQISVPTLFQRRINNYVPAMQYAHDVNNNGAVRVPFGAPPAAVSNNLLNAVSIAVAINVDLTQNANAQNITAPFGRTIQFVLSGAGTPVITIKGADYLGQPVSENVTAAGATPVSTKRAYKYVDSISCGVVAATTLSAGWGAALGLPYKALAVTREIANGANVGTLGTFVAAALPDPATATTGDPRGIYTPTTALNGANIISADFYCVNDVNGNNNGGLHGIKQFFN